MDHVLVFVLLCSLYMVILEARLAGKSVFFISLFFSRHLS